MRTIIIYLTSNLSLLISAMSKNLLSRYIWIIDTIRRHGSITRDELNRRWRNSPFYTGEDLPRRTFYNYRNAIEELFNVNIGCNPSTYEYFIEHNDAHEESMTDWLLNSAATNSVLSGARDLSQRIFIEDVPSARVHLSVVMDALRECHVLKFTYHSYSRSMPVAGLQLEPYFLKIFRQRWYVTGRNRAEDTVKTYALDRMSDVTMDAERFVMPPDFDAESYSRDSYGIIFSHGEPKTVRIKTDSRQAKYFRALPLHHSQSEIIHDSYSIFTYRLRLTPDLVQELLGYGPRIKVIEPPELKAMMVTNLRDTLDQYEEQA